MNKNRENYDLGRDPNDVDLFKKKMNEELFEEMKKTIASLKAELKLERACTDFYANISNWNGEDSTGWRHTNIICTEDQDEKITGTWNPYGDDSLPREDEYEDVGGKLARATQAKRRVSIES